MDFLESRQYWRRIPHVRDGVAHFDFLRAFDVGRHVTGLANFELLADVWLWIEAADFLDFDIFARVQQLNLHSRLQFAIEDPNMSDNAFVRVEIRIESERL